MSHASPLDNSSRRIKRETSYSPLSAEIPTTPSSENVPTYDFTKKTSSGHVVPFNLLKRPSRFQRLKKKLSRKKSTGGKKSTKKHHKKHHKKHTKKHHKKHTKKH